MMLVTRVTAVLLIVTGLHSASSTNSSVAVQTSPADKIIGTFYKMREEAVAIREEAVVIREEAQRIRQEGYEAVNRAYQVKDEAYELKDSAYESRSELESVLVEAFSLLKSQTTATSLYIQDIKNTLTTVASRMDRLETKIEGIESKLEKKTGAIESKLEEKTESIESKVEEKTEAIESKLEEKTEALEQQTEDLKTTVQELKNDLSKKVETSIALSATVKNRQQVWLSEIRLISLYKMVDQNNPHWNYAEGIVTDGNFVHSATPDEMLSHSHTGSKARDNKLWINLGGLFKIHRVYRNCCTDQLVGTHVYADQELIGTVIEADKFHDFLVPDGDPTYASTITLHQPLPKNIHVLEIQVWGAGPFSQDDIFM